MGTAITFLKVFIQGPGLGSFLAQAGNRHKSSQGVAMPSERKTSIASAAGWVSA